LLSSNMPNAPTPCSAEMELARMFADVPMRVQVPPTIEMNDMGISIFVGLMRCCRQILMVMGMKTATAAALLMNAEITATVTIKRTNDRVWLSPPRRASFWLIQLTAPVFISPALSTNMAAMVAVASLLKPEMPSWGVAKLGLNSPMTISTVMSRMATRSTLSFSEANRIKKATMITQTRTISNISAALVGLGGSAYTGESAYTGKSAYTDIAPTCGPASSPCRRRVYGVSRRPPHRPCPPPARTPA